MAGSGKPTPKKVASDIYADVSRTSDPYYCRSQAIARSKKACSKHDKSSATYGSCMRYNMKRKTLEMCWDGFLEDTVASRAKALCVGSGVGCTATTEQTIADLLDPNGYAHQTLKQRKQIEKAKEAAIAAAQAQAASKAAARAAAAQEAAESSAKAASQAEEHLPIFRTTTSSAGSQFKVKPWHIGVGAAALVGAWYVWKVR